MWQIIKMKMQYRKSALQIIGCGKGGKASEQGESDAESA